MEYKKRQTKKVKLPKDKKQSKQKNTVKLPQEKQEEKITQIKMEQKTSKANKDIERKPANIKEQKPVFKKIKGGSKFKFSKTFKTSAVCILLVLVVLIFQIATPTGIYDFVQNSLASIGGTNNMPVNVPGNKSIGVFTDNNIVHALTDTTLYSYNSSGKEINFIQHGYMSPCLVTTGQRTLIYDRGNTGIRVDSLYTNYINKNFDEKIYTADLSENGRLAVVSTKDNYTCQLQVFEKNYEDLIVAYSSADQHISCVKLSSNGKYAVFSALSVKNGAYCSTVKILNTLSQEIIKEFEIKNMMINKMAVTSSCVFVQGSNRMFTFNWKGEDLKEYDYADMSYFIQNDNDTVCVVHHPSGDARTSEIEVFNKNGKKLFEVKSSGTLSGVCSSKNRIYTLIDNKIYEYNNKSEIVNEFTTGYQYNSVAQYKDGVICISDMKINYYK